MNKDNFIGGRVPEEVKRELKARAVSNGQTMQELLESILFGYLEGNQNAAPGMDRDDLIDSIREAIQEAELPIPDTDTAFSSEDLQDAVNIAVEEALGRMTQHQEDSQSVLEQRIKAHMQTNLASVKEELEDAILDIENNMVYVDDGEEDEPGDFAGYRKLMAEEVNCVIVSAFEGFLEEEDFDRVEVLRRIGRQFFLEAEEPRSPKCYINFRQVLPEDFAVEVGEVVQLAIEDMEFTDEKMDVFGKLAELFNQAAQLALKAQNTIQITFDNPDHIAAIDQLVDALGENKAAIRGRHSLIRYLIGQALLKEGEKSFWSEDAFLVNVGKEMMEAR